MELRPFVEGLQADLEGIAAVGDDAVAEAAKRLTSAVGAFLRGTSRSASRGKIRRSSTWRSRGKLPRLPRATTPWSPGSRYGFPRV